MVVRFAIVKRLLLSLGALLLLFASPEMRTAVPLAAGVYASSSASHEPAHPRVQVVAETDDEESPEDLADEQDGDEVWAFVAHRPALATLNAGRPFSGRARSQAPPMNCPAVEPRPPC